MKRRIIGFIHEKNYIFEYFFLIVLIIVLYLTFINIRNFDTNAQNYMNKSNKAVKQIANKIDKTKFKISCHKKNCIISLDDEKFLNELRNISNLKEKYYDNQSYWLNCWLTFIGSLLTFITIIMPYLVMRSNEKLEEKVNKELDDNLKTIKEKYNNSFEVFYENKKSEFDIIVREAKEAIENCYKVIEDCRKFSEVKQIDNLHSDNKKLQTLNEYLKKAQYLSHKELYNEAIEQYKKALNLDKEDYSILHNIGYCYAKQKEYEKALTYFENARKIYNNDSTLHCIVLMYVYMEKYNDALQYCNMALELNQNSKDCLNDKYIICIKLKQYSEALSIVKKIIGLYPADICEYYNLTEAYIFNNDIDNAIISLKTYIEKYTNPFIYSDDFDIWTKQIEKLNAQQKEKDELNNLIRNLPSKNREDDV